MLYQFSKHKVKSSEVLFSVFNYLFVLDNYNQLGSLSYLQQPPPSLAAPTDYSRQTQLNPYKVYRRFPNPIQPIPSYSNGAVVQIYGQTNFNNQQQSSSMIAQNPNEQQLTLQIRRERQRRAMVDRMILLFDDDGLFFVFFYYYLILSSI
jgi:hypothetical protein